MSLPGYPEFTLPLTPANFPVRRCPVTREQAETRILIIRAGAFGDILMGTPLLAALRDRYPNGHLTWLAEHTEQQAVDANPYLDELLIWNGRFWKQKLRRLNYATWLANALRFRADLQARHFDTLISFQPEEWPLLTQHSGATVRIGIFDSLRQYLGATSTSSNTRYYTHPFTYDALPLHRTDQYLLPLKVLGDAPPAAKQMQMGFTRDDAARADAVLHGANIGSNFAVFAPLTTWESRCWPADRWVQLGDQMQQAGTRVICIGSPKEAHAIKAIADRMVQPPLVLGGTLTFREIAALIARAQVVVANDGGPMHVAAAVGTPFVSLFGPTPVKGRAPLAGRGIALMHPVSCGPCDQRVCPNPPETHLICLKLISVEEAFAAVQQVMAPSAPPQRIPA